MRKKFITVNRILGESPNLGPFPADQIMPWSGIAIVGLFLIHYLLQGDWLTTGVCIAWGWATWWVVTANKSFKGKFVRVPRITRGYMPFVPLKNDRHE
jgi:hypothetical protein